MFLFQISAEEKAAHAEDIIDSSRDLTATKLETMDVYKVVFPFFFLDAMAFYLFSFWQLSGVILLHNTKQMLTCGRAMAISG